MARRRTTRRRTYTRRAAPKRRTRRRSRGFGGMAEWKKLMLGAGVILLYERFGEPFVQKYVGKYGQTAVNLAELFGAAYLKTKVRSPIVKAGAEGLMWINAYQLMGNLAAPILAKTSAAPVLSGGLQ